jgi:pyruvate dehydrogenase E1 component alpha subunit
MKNIFNEYNPIDDKIFRIIDDDGKVINKEWKPDLSDEYLLDAYKFMQFARMVDVMAVSYQRQGRMYTYPPNLGQEAIAAAAGFQMNKEDWLVPAFREVGAWLKKGARPRDIFLYFGGHEDGSRFSGAPNFMPSSVPIASQLQHAAGIGYALNYNKEKAVVFAFVGDGGTSQGDFHEALNFAAVWKAPVIFIVQNNQYAISLPVAKQTVSINLAVKSVAYGIKGIKVDGNDFLAMSRVISEAKQYALDGNGPVLIEGLTYRKGAHTTSDDPTLYRTSEEEKEWDLKDPIKRLGMYLESKKMWNPKDEEAMLDEYRKEVEKEFDVYENYPPYPVDDVFDYQYEDMPEDLKQQKIDYEKFLNWKESKK